MLRRFRRLPSLLPLCLLVLWAALAGVPLHAEPADIAAAARGVVRVVIVEDSGRRIALKGHGSGVAIAPDLVLTNAHLVAEVAQDSDLRVGVVPPQGSTGSFARIVALSPRNDLALIRVTGEVRLPVASLFTGPVEDGADVYAVGYPGNVDMAQGLNIADIVSPTQPVKTRGSVSAGRSSKQFDTILHTAPIGSGNSGGPLLDACGRVIGLNSFGTVSGNADSEFYFAVSMREVMRFLTAFEVRPQSTGVACRSIADLDAAEAERIAADREREAERQRIANEKRDAARHAAEREAQIAVIAERENGMALAGLAVILALALGGGSLALAQDRKGARTLARIAAFALLIAAIAAWFNRPSLDSIDARVQAALKAQEGKDKQGDKAQGESASETGAQKTGRLVCVLDTERSRVTVSPMTDVLLSWTPQGCVNGRTQYGLSASGWTRMLIPREEDTATLATYDPATSTYRTERFLLDHETMERLRAARALTNPPSCGADEASVRRLGDEQDAFRALLPASPNERLVYRCQEAPPVPPASGT